MLLRPLIFLTHVAGENVQLGPVFGHRTARDRDATFAENLDNFLVAQWRGSWLVFTRSMIASFTLVLLIETPLEVW